MDIVCYYMENSFGAKYTVGGGIVFILHVFFANNWSIYCIDFSLEVNLFEFNIKKTAAGPQLLQQKVTGWFSKFWTGRFSVQEMKPEQSRVFCTMTHTVGREL